MHVIMIALMCYTRTSWVLHGPVPRHTLAHEQAQHHCNNKLIRDALPGQTIRMLQSNRLGFAGVVPRHSFALELQQHSHTVNLRNASPSSNHMHVIHKEAG